ncbi:hypothetical protein JD844_015118 [Phrynosoma platyrhinos]|uniref:Armadillo repeat protein deleted in velo-cardio-facial syndrome n=1 Tax=Phrynosoma platyrhinos TaxID=52577 RepID=A0ABQ7T815_PHRPL|nr:hypothetical protein JD844_015118 [Phrynosoma platyrhinos]
MDLRDKQVLNGSWNSCTLLELASKGFELLYQPEVVRLYLSILTESQNFNTLEAAAGALQNLSAGNWTWSTYIRATVRKERGLPVLVELLQSDSDKVVRAVSIALRNLSMDRRNKDLIGSYAMGELVRNLPSRQQRSSKNLEEDTVVAVLNTIHEIITDSSENARSLIQTQGIQKLVAISKSRCRDGYSTIDHREKERKYKANDNMGDASEKEPLKNDTNRKTINRSNRASVTLVDARDPKPQPVDSWV